MRLPRCAVVLSLAVAGFAGLAGCGGGEEEAIPAAGVAQPTAETEAVPERHIPLEGQPNFRDLGGYETVGGRTVKWGEVYRSGELPELTDADVDRLGELGLRTVVNFLLPEEIEMHGPDRVPVGVRQVPQPITGERTAELSLSTRQSIRTGQFENIPPEMNVEFHRLLLEDGKAEYAALLRELMDPANRPLVYHCSHGLHRTGTASAILLSALGVPWETVREDYLLSNTYLAEETEAQLTRIREMVARDRGVDPEEVDMTNVEAFYILEGSYIDGTLERAMEEFGSMEGYIRDGLGITDEEIELLRTELLR